MFRSRSNSRSSQGSETDIRVTSPGPSSPRPQDDQIVENESPPPPTFKITDPSEPMSDIITAMAEKINDIITLKKGKNRIAEIDIPTLKAVYNSKNTLDQEILEKKLKQTSEDTHARFIDNQLRGYDINPVIEAPKNYSPVPVLVKPSISSQLLQMFPRRPYSGESNGRVVEFLNNMCLAQERANLSKSEFLDQLVKLTSGGPHRLVVNMKSHNEPISQIFYALISSYHDGPSSQTARAELHNLKANKNDTMTSLHAKILDLSQTASRMFLPGENRKTYFNNLACLSLIQCLPDAGQGYNPHQLVNQIFHTLSNQLQKPPTYSQLFNALIPYQSQINQSIKMYGTNTSGNYGNSENRGRNKNFSYNKGRKDYNSYFRPRIFNANIDTDWSSKNAFSANRNSAPYTNSNGDGVPYSRNGFPPVKNNYSNPKGNFNNRFNGNRNFSGNRSFQGRGENKATYTKNNTGYPKNRKFCLLCSSTTHRASDGCFLFKKDGVQRYISPTQKPCSICLKTLNKKNFHPESLCFSKKSD